MRHHSHRVRLPWRRSLPAREAAREVRLLSLSEGLSFCVQLRAVRDPRFERELTRWLERARREGVLGSADAKLLGAAVVASEGAFQELTGKIVKRARGQLFAPARRRSRPVSATVKVASVSAVSLIAAGTGIMNAHDESLSPSVIPRTSVARPLLVRTVAVSRRCPIPSRLRVAFVAASNSTGLPLSLLVAVARTESHFDDTATSGAGAVGVLQLMPDTARALGVDPTDPDANVVAGARYLRSLYSRFGSMRLAIAAYNAGPTSVAARAGRLDVGTTTYVANVQRTRRSLRGCD